MDMLPKFHLIENRKGMTWPLPDWCRTDFTMGTWRPWLCWFATLTTLKFSGRSQMIAMALSFALGFLIWSPLFKKYKTNIVAQLLHVELLNIFNFLVKFISGRRFSPYGSRKSNMLLKIFWVLIQTLLSLRTVWSRVFVCNCCINISPIQEEYWELHINIINTMGGFKQNSIKNKLQSDY